MGKLKSRPVPILETRKVILTPKQKKWAAGDKAFTKLSTQMISKNHEICEALNTSQIHSY